MRFSLRGYVCLCAKKEKNKIFEEVDHDNDNKITMNEFHHYYKLKYGEPPSKDQWFKFHIADKNNDGCLTKEDIEAFESENTLFKK